MACSDFALCRNDFPYGRRHSLQKVVVTFDMKKKGTFSVLIGLLLIAAALCITGYNLVENNSAGKSSETILEQLLPLTGTDPIPPSGQILHGGPVSGSESNTAGTNAPDSGEIIYPDYVLNPNMAMPVRIVDGAEFIGVLRIPSAELELPIHSKWSYSLLKKAPCRYFGSAYLKNMVICAHDYRTHFYALRDLHVGDEITFTDMDGNLFTYRVAEIEHLMPEAEKEMRESDYALTLFTCTIDGRRRVTVRCDQVA